MNKKKKIKLFIIFLLIIILIFIYCNRFIKNKFSKSQNITSNIDLIDINISLKNLLKKNKNIFRLQNGDIIKIQLKKNNIKKLIIIIRLK
jgi:hypothetical protein